MWQLRGRVERVYRTGSEMETCFSGAVHLERDGTGGAGADPVGQQEKVETVGQVEETGPGTQVLLVRVAPADPARLRTLPARL